jgi:hypothetical protein
MRSRPASTNTYQRKGGRGKRRRRRKRNSIDINTDLG